VKRGLVLAVAIAVAGGAGVSAQQPVQQAPAQPMVQVPGADVQSSSSNLQRRRKQIHTMEGILTSAVRSGAEDLASRMRSLNPSVTLFTGHARARGFLLDGYGVFFDVEIPDMLESVAWMIQSMERDLTMTSMLDTLKRALAEMPNSPNRMQAEQALGALQRVAGPRPQLASPNAAAPGAIAAASVNVMPENPHEAYTESVKSALIDAMLDYSLPIDLQPDEWLSVAARSSGSPMATDQVYETVTIVLRVKGSDLSAYHADRSKRDEIRKRVEVRVF
jgi:hypothetical protein